MKKVVLSTVVAMALATSSFAWGLPSVPGMGSSQDIKNVLSENDVELVFAGAKIAESLMNNSTIAITGILSGSKAKEALDAALADADKIAELGDRNAKKSEILQTASAKAIQDGNTADGQANLKKLSANQKVEAGKAFTNFALAGFFLPKHLFRQKTAMVVRFVRHNVRWAL